MTATTPAGVDVRDCRLYRFWVEDPLTGEEVLGYIGETVRQPFERLMEHVKDQPWIDTVTRWERDPVVYAGKRAVLEAEAAAIRAERPLYNVRENDGNTDRVIPPVAIRQRRARDAQRGRQRWVHPDDRNGSDRSTSAVSGRRVSATRRRTAAQVKVLIVSWVLAWLGIAAMTLGFTVRNDLGGASQRVWVTGLVPTAFIAFGYFRGPRVWSAFKRSIRRRIRGLF